MDDRSYESGFELESPYIAEEALSVTAKPAGTLPATKVQYGFQVVDAGGKPVAGLAWSIHQDGAVYRGTLDAQGNNGTTAGFGKFVASRPFVLHVEGHVCAIVKGARLVADDPSVEYGGQFVDWRLADSDTEAERNLFWQEYAKERKNRKFGVFRFLQHDHVMRRPVAFLRKATHAVFEAHPVALRLGPILRYVDARRAHVWVELETPGLVRVRYGKAPQPSSLPPPGTPAKVLVRHASTVRVGGRHFALVELDGLDADSVYLYTLDFGPIPPSANGGVPASESDFGAAVFPVQLPGAVARAQAAVLTERSFRNNRWLFFRTPRATFDDFRFAHGSCRKWPSDTNLDKKAPGPDMLDAFSSSFLANRKTWEEWPQFFLHTGDQIYADDIGITLGAHFLRERFASVVPGPAPKDADDVTYGAWAGRFGFRYRPVTKPKASEDDVDPKYLRGFFDYRGFDRAAVDRVFDRAIVARNQASSQAKLADPARPLRFKLRVQNHLLWSVPTDDRDMPIVDLARGLLTPRSYAIPHRNRSYQLGHPSAGETNPFDKGAGGVHCADFAEYAAAYEQAFRTGTRRALAHVANYMIFDDHEVTDDWNGDSAWLASIHSKSDRLRAWPHTITDALCAYWLYQGWGNLSPEACANDPRVTILERCQKSGRDALPELRKLVLDRGVRPTAAGADRRGKLDWQFEVPAGTTPFLVVDMRTDQDMNADGRLSAERMRWMEERLLRTKSPVAFLVFPVPFLMPDPMLFAFRNAGFVSTLASSPSTTAFRRGSDLEHPAGNAIWDQVKKLFESLQRSSSLKTVVFVSGDIHFTCSLDGQLEGSSRAPRMLQLVSSGLQQKISTDLQNKLTGSYSGAYNTVTGSQGQDTHRGVRITVAGLVEPSKKTRNFLFDTSFAVVDVKSLLAGSNAGKTRVPLIVQTSWAVGPNRLEPYSVRHMTQPTGSAIMTLKNPGSKPPPGWPPEYPSGEGIGLVKEADGDG